MSRLRELRKSRGLKLCELSARANVNYSNLSRYEHGWALPSEEIAARLALALCCDLADFDYVPNQGGAANANA